MPRPAGPRDARSVSEKIDQWAAKPMFALSLLFLLFLAGTLHLQDDGMFFPSLDACLWGMVALYPFYVIELCVQLATRGRFWKQNLVFCLIPPLRLGARDHVTGKKIWLPFKGWVAVDRELQDAVEKGFSLPMIIIALLMLPLFAMEWRFDHQVSTDSLVDLRHVLDDKGPHDVNFLGSRGHAWLLSGNRKNAFDDLNLAIRMGTTSAGAYCSRGSAFMEQGDYDRALEDFDEAIDLDAKHVDAHTARAWLRAACPLDKFRDGKQAVVDATRACELTDWENDRPIAALAAAEAEAGHFQQAVRYQSKAIKFFREKQVPAVYAAQLASYEAKQPLRSIDLPQASAYHPRLALFAHASMGVIWFAFALEFIVMIGVVENKLKYSKEHWIDLAVILLPIVAFVRAARLGRLLRLQQISKVQQLSKTARIYRIRGLMMRAQRAILMLDLLHRLLRTDSSSRLSRLRETLGEKEREIVQLRQQIYELEQLVEANDEHPPVNRAA